MDTSWTTEPPALRAPGAPALSLRGLARSFRVPRRGAPPVDALKGVDLDLSAGSFTAIVGASGSGKSTLLLCAAGLDRPTSGSVRILGTEITALSGRARAGLRAADVGVIFQDDNLVTALNARDNVALPGRLRRAPLRRGDVEAALERVGLSAQARRMPAELSGGERQRVAVARVLAARPPLVFADEPTASLDLVAGESVLGWLGEAAAEGATVLMVTHDAEAASRADRVIVMDAGRVTGELPGGDAHAVAAAVLSQRTRDSGPGATAGGGRA
jgi:putative ABC transport system ATP-binding protein